MDFEQRKNINRGYRKLIVWRDAVAFYALTYDVFKAFPFILQRVVSQQIASVDSIHRNIAEGYCRRSLKEYLQFLNFALSSAGESVSGLHAYRLANHISETDFERLDTAAWKLENGLKRLIESLQQKKEEGGWQDSFLQEDVVPYNAGDQLTPWRDVGTVEDWKDAGMEEEDGRMGKDGRMERDASHSILPSFQSSTPEGESR